MCIRDRAVKKPLFGLALKTIDGVMVYGYNTRIADYVMHPVEKGSTVIFKFTMRLNLFPGDYFLDLGVAEKLPVEDKLMDIRYDLVHLCITAKDRFDGIVDLESTCKEVLRKSVPV